MAWLIQTPSDRCTPSAGTTTSSRRYVTCCLAESCLPGEFSARRTGSPGLYEEIVIIAIDKGYKKLDGSSFDFLYGHNEYLYINILIQTHTNYPRVGIKIFRFCQLPVKLDPKSTKRRRLAKINRVCFLPAAEVKIKYLVLYYILGLG